MKRRQLRIYFWLILGLLAVFLASCSPPVPSVTATSPSEPAGLSGKATSLTTPPAATQGTSELNVTTPTPRPTVAPGAITNLVETVTEAVGVENTLILGLTPEDWINLIISLLFILFGFLIAGSLAIRLLRFLVKRLSVKVDQNIMDQIEPQIKWLIIMLILQFAIARLIFVSAEVKNSLGNVFFIVYLVIILSSIWRLVDLAIERYIEEATSGKDAERVKPLLPLLHRVSHVILLVLGAQVLLGRLGIELGTIFTAMGIGGLAISLAAQDVLSDLIAGFIILVSQPFRVGDRIEIQGLDTWGDVVEIGIRTTNIRTRDNRMVIVPNSIIGKSQVVNYTYPDPRYRVQIEIGIAYGTDIEHARKIIIETVRNIDGVLKDKPVDALYDSMGDSAMIFRVRWWIESYTDTRRNFDRVNTALQNALDAAGIEMPFPTQALNVSIKSDLPEEENDSDAGQNAKGYPTKTQE